VSLYLTMRNPAPYVLTRFPENPWVLGHDLT
jgi:hypothetical protein